VRSVGAENLLNRSDLYGPDTSRELPECSWSPSLLVDRRVRSRHRQSQLPVMEIRDE
jgi:hypothetical protein